MVASGAGFEAPLLARLTDRTEVVRPTSEQVKASDRQGQEKRCCSKTSTDVRIVQEERGGGVVLSHGVAGRQDRKSVLLEVLENTDRHVESVLKSVCRD